METQDVTAQIGLLVDHFRSDQEKDVTLGDVAAVTEVLLSTLQRYFSSIDTSIYKEFRSLSEKITSARTEIAHMSTENEEDEHIPRAGRELEAIVQATEESTGTIMDAAEEIMSADLADADAASAQMNDACMRIFEACSFQDITGQRITKVVETLTFLEDRLGALGDTLEAKIKLGPQAKSKEMSEDDPDFEKAHLLKSPALAGEGIDQYEVDNLSAGDDAIVDKVAEDPGPIVKATAPAKQRPADKPVDAQPSPAKPKAKQTPKKPDPVPVVEAAGEEFSQDDIDALFD